MKIWVGQIYIKPGVNFPFSHLMQRWISERLSSVAGENNEFQKKLGPDYELMIRLSADTGIPDNVIKGPTVFKSTKDVEYSLFLPYDAISRGPPGRWEAAALILAGIRRIFELAGVATASLDGERDALIEQLATDPTMLDGPWPG